MRSGRLLQLLKATGVLLLLLCCAEPAIAAGTADLTVMFTHDLHSYFSPHHALGPDGNRMDVGGYARLAGAVGEERRHNDDGTLLVDAGDFAQGTLYHTVFSSEALELRLMGAMGYDAITFGNHDFDFYPSGLSQMLSAARAKAGLLPPLVFSNIVFSRDDPRDAGLKKAFAAYPVREYLILKRKGVRIGIFGLLGKDAAEDTPFSAPLAFADPVQAARKMVRVLREQEKADLVICLSHSGTNPVRSHSEDENLAAEVPGIDVIISGHTHTLLPKPRVVGGTVIVASGAYGTNLGVLGLRVRHGGNVEVTRYQLRRIDAGVPEDPEISRQIVGFREIVEDRYLSHFGYRFDQVLAFQPFRGEALDQLYAHPGENGLGNLVADAYRYAVKRAEGSGGRRVDVAIDVLGCIRSPLFLGDIRTSDVFQTASLGPSQYGYCGNTLVAGYLTGEDLKQLLEVETSLAPSKKDGHLSVSGIRFCYNPNRIFFDRVTSIELQGDDGNFAPVVKDRLYRVVVNSYLANLVDLIGKKSFGILKVAFRDEQGRVVRAPEALTVMNHGEALREWVALAEYLSSFQVQNGTPAVPERYARPGGRIVVAASWNPIDLVAGGNRITWIALGLVAAVFSLAVLLVRRLIGILFRRAS